MKHKLTLAYLLLLIVLLFPAFRAAVKEDATNASSNPVCSRAGVSSDSVRTDCRILLSKPRATSIILQSKDGGETWQDISLGLPEDEEPEGFFAGGSDLYLRIKNKTYHSKNNLTIPVWEEEDILDPRCTSITFNPSGVIAYNYKGQVYRKTAGRNIWLPVFENFKNQSVRSIFETSDGRIFLSSDDGLFKSSDQGGSWKRVVAAGADLVESEGVLLGANQHGIIRSIDQGDNWETVINEGGVGIAVERIDGGFAAIFYSSTTQSRRIVISMDRGKTWRAIDGGLRPSQFIASIKQVGRYLLCGHPDGIFRSSDMGKTWTIVHPNLSNALMYQAPVKGFQLHVSGDVLFAVLRNSGC